ncbi:MAG: bifunctional precorrin-2 dehydrogenase/sirohydrochlorin ferrochelatase [Desulfatiglandaceae bacterium]|jgi:precorrin-2 dehydrogenase / sirohydrochlorin ferrochelatase
MAYYPIFLNLTNKKALVVGGGQVAQRKVETLLECDASVSVVSRDLTPMLKEWADQGKIEYRGTTFEGKMLDGIFIVISATDDSQLNHKVSVFAQERGLLINAVDQPEDCNFIVPAIIRRGDLQVAISTSGKSPALARKIRIELEQYFGEEYGKMLLLMGKARDWVLSKGLPQEKNRQLFHKLVESDMMQAITRGDRKRGVEILRDVFGDDISPDRLLKRVFKREVK